MKLKIFRTRLRSLFLLAYSQYILRILLRSIWAFGAGFLLGWAISGTWGMLINQRSWWLLGAGLALISLSEIFWKAKSVSAFAWNLDRNLKFNEQISAAWQMRETEAETQIGGELTKQAADSINEILPRLRQKGWQLRRELDLIVVIALLAIAVYLSGIGTISFSVEGNFALLPGLGLIPSTGDVFPGGIPGATSEEISDSGGAGGEGSQDDQSEQQGDFSNITAEELGEVGDVLSELGEELSEITAASELGGALEQGDYQEAAEEVGDLAGQVDQLSQDTRDEIAEDLQQAADQLDQPGQEGLAESLENAAESMQNGDPSEAGESFDQLARELQAIGQQTAQDPLDQAGVTTDNQDGLQQEGEGQGGETAGASSGLSDIVVNHTTPFERLDGVGETLSLEAVGDLAPLLQPGEPFSGDSEQIAGGVVESLGELDPEIISSILEPYSMPWWNRDVVTTYFSPR